MGTALQPDIARTLDETLQSVSHSIADVFSATQGRDCDQVLNFLAGRLHDAYENGVDAGRRKDGAGGREFMAEVASTSLAILVVTEYQRRHPDTGGGIIH